MSAERPVMVAPVTHRYEPGWVPVTLGDTGEVHRGRPDPARCARCGRREDDRAHG